jgi:hypothetical protein
MNKIKKFKYNEWLDAATLSWFKLATLNDLKLAVRNPKVLLLLNKMLKTKEGKAIAERMHRRLITSKSS